MAEGYVYNPWPIGNVPKEFQRDDLDRLEESGYSFDDPRDVVTLFENKVAEYAGSKHAIAVDNCTDALFLCLTYLKASGEITMPCKTWLSAALSVLHVGCKVKFEDFNWSGAYQLKPYPIYDSAVRFTKDMYVPGSYYCLSFQIKKRLPIGKGGMILVDDEQAAKWLRSASFEGRNLDLPYDKDDVSFAGWNMYMTPEDAARGLLIFDQLPEVNEDAGCQDDYHDISDKRVFKNG